MLVERNEEQNQNDKFNDSHMISWCQVLEMGIALCSIPVRKLAAAMSASFLLREDLSVSSQNSTIKLFRSAFRPFVCSHGCSSRCYAARTAPLRASGMPKVVDNTKTINYVILPYFE